MKRPPGITVRPKHISIQFLYRLVGPSRRIMIFEECEGCAFAINHFVLQGYDCQICEIDRFFYVAHIFALD